MTENAPRLLVVLLCALAGEARAQVPPPAAVPAPVAAPAVLVPDPVFRAVVGRKVELRLLDGQVAVGQLLALEAESAVLALPDGRVTSVPRAQVMEVRLAAAAPAAGGAFAPPVSTAVSVDLPRAERAPDIAGKPRHFGVQFGLAPGILALDLEVGHFYGFLSGSLALPLYSVGTNNDGGGLGAFTLAPGVSFALTDDMNWHFDLFVSGSIAYFGRYDWMYGRGLYTAVDGSVGVGLGFHYTNPNGFTAGFKVPIVGFAFGDDVHGWKDVGGYHYLTALMSLPIATVGYRF